MKNVSDIDVRHSLAKMIGGGNPFYLKFWVKLTALERNHRFSSIFATSTAAITPSEKG